MRNLVQITKSRMQSQSLIEKIIKTGYGSFLRQICFMSEDRQIRNCKNLESGQSGNLRNQTKSWLLESHFGKIGNVLWAFANGWDEDPVCKEGYEAPVKSIGNSTTTPRDLENDLDVWIIQIALAESVAARLRKHGFKCKTVEITVRDNGLYSFSRQMHLRQPTNITDEIVTAAFQLFKDNYKWEHPIRSLGIRAADLVLDDIPVQLDLFGNQEKKEKLEKLDRTVDEIRRRFGYFSIQRAAMYQDKVLSHLDAGTHTVHPHSYFHG